MLIEVERLEHRFAVGGDTVIQPFSHRFEPSTLTAVTGPSGSGKSALMYILALILTPSGGTTLWDGENVQSLPDHVRSRLRARHAGFVFQDALLDPSQTALDNVLEAGWLAGSSVDAARTRAMQLLDRFGVADRATHLPGQVSGWQAQRIALCSALCSALVKGLTIVFADEPTGNLDRDSAKIVWAALADVAREGATVVVATHDPRPTTRLAPPQCHTS